VVLVGSLVLWSGLVLWLWVGLASGVAVVISITVVLVIVVGVESINILVLPWLSVGVD